MRVIGKSPEGQVALGHFGLLLFAFVVYIAYVPVRPSEATQHQIVISEIAWTVITILIFPIGYIGYSFPKALNQMNSSYFGLF